MERPFSVAVYCGSSPGVDEPYSVAARDLGAAIARRGWRLVYGAGSTGLMGDVARGAHAAGGTVYGVIPHALDALEVTYEECDELIRVETMRERKALMEQNADAFIALPGGFGTLEELIEIVVLKQLGYIDRPIVLLSTRAYWQPLIALFESMIAHGFARPATSHLYRVVEEADEALDYIANYYPARDEGEPPAWLWPNDGLRTER